MAVLTVNGNPVVGTKYSVTTANSADWASVANDTYFYDLGDKLVHYKNPSGVVLELFSDGVTADEHKWKLSPIEVFRGTFFNNNSTTTASPQTLGVAVPTASATLVARSVANTNFASKVIGIGVTASVVSSGRYSGLRGSALLWYLGAGFRFVASFNISDTAYGAGCRQFYGMQGSTADLTFTDAILVDSLINCIGVGSDALDTNLQIFHNDGTGLCTKIDLGANFPANRTVGAISTTIYDVQILNEPNQTNVHYRVVNNETGAVATGTINSNLPLASQGLNYFSSRTMGAPLTNTGQYDLKGKFGVYSM